MAVLVLNNVVPERVERFTSNYEELDWVYGRKGDWGIPWGRISLWAGEKGVGKTRLLSQLMKSWDMLGLSTMIFQGEVSMGQFASEKMNGYQSDRMYVSDDTDIFAQVKAIHDYKPNIVITDSVQQIEQYKGGRGAKEIVRELRKVLSVTGTHVIFISQLTAAGKTRGGSELPHEVDIECNLMRWAPKLAPALFVLKTQKNRYGHVGKEAVFCHTDEGVECQSMHRMKDKDWVGEKVLEEMVEKKKLKWRWW